jgi:hypothetical protein
MNKNKAQELTLEMLRKKYDSLIDYQIVPECSKAIEKACLNCSYSTSVNYNQFFNGGTPATKLLGFTFALCTFPPESIDTTIAQYITKKLSNYFPDCTIKIYTASYGFGESSFPGFIHISWR